MREEHKVAMESWVLAILFSLLIFIHHAFGLASEGTLRKVRQINRHGPYLGLIIPNPFEMNPLLLNSTLFKPSKHIPNLDISGRRFHIGEIEKHKVILVMSGLAMLNAGITTQLLLDTFKVSGVLNYGIAGSANNSLNIGDVIISKYWAHAGLWSWQRYGKGPNDYLPFEGSGDYTRALGFLHIGDYNVPEGKSVNLLNNIWFQPEEVYTVAEVREHHFWVPVYEAFYKLAEKITDLRLQPCINVTTCLSEAPKVVLVEKGVSSSIFVDNAAYRSFLNAKFGAASIEMETAAVALVSMTNKVPFIAFRALSDLAGGSSHGNEAVTFSSVAVQNAITAVTAFMKLLHPKWQQNP